MPRFRITIDDQRPIVAGPSGSEAFSISVHDGLSIEESSKCGGLPKIVVATVENRESRGPVFKYWLEEKASPGTRIHIEVLEDGEIDRSSRTESEETPLEMCWYCFKNADDVDYLVRAPSSTMHICNECVDICSNEIQKRRAGFDSGT